MRLIKNGEFQIISKTALAKKQKEAIMENASSEVMAKREGSKQGAAPLVNMSLKSRRDLIHAIQNGKTLHAIKNLSIISIFLLLALVVLASVDYGLFTARYSTIMSNLKTFIKSLDMKTQISQAVENTRNLVLLNSSMLTTYENYSTAANYEAKIRTKLLAIQSTIDSTQKDMSNLAKSFSRLSNTLLSNRDLTVKFKISSDYKVELYNLQESITMFNSYIFKIANTALTSLSESNDDVYFVLANGLNGIIVRLVNALDDMRQDMSTYRQKSLNELIVILVCSCGTIFLGGLLLIPFLSKVKSAKEEILMLFFQIKRNYAKNFAKQCQQFYNSLQKKRNRQDAGSEGEGSEKDMDDEEGEEEEDKGVLVADARNFSQMAGPTTRKLKKGANDTIGLIVCEVFANILLSCYFVLCFVLLGTLLFSSIQTLAESFETIYDMNGAYFLDYLAIREMVLNSTWEVENSNSYVASQTMIDRLTVLQERVKDYFGLDTSELSMYFGGFTDIVDSVYDNSVCTNGRNNYFSDEATCSSFAHTISEKVPSFPNDYGL
ncbi:MAG: hypothetical protein P4M11_10190 [Candidatus Pacebacteria bacterium]|nr:hypothetical protein [Candidatus Paceibacterota bacterium]